MHHYENIGQGALIDRTFLIKVTETSGPDVLVIELKPWEN